MATGRTLHPDDKAYVDSLQRIALAVVLCGWAAAGTTDTDIWGHMAIGLDMLTSGRFLWVDPYSFTHDQRWVNHEWLWDIVVGVLYQRFGLAGLVALRAVLIGFVLCLVDRSSRNAPSPVRALTLVLVSIASIGAWTATRPQVATITLYAIVLTHVRAAWLPILFALWANTHGGWLIGFGAVVTHAAFERTRRSTILAALCLAATLVNPYGVHLWLALADAIHRGWADVSEWAPVWSRPFGLAPLSLALLLIGCLAFLWRRVHHDPWAWIWTLVMSAAGVRSGRLMVFAVVTSAIVLLPQWSARRPQVTIAWNRTRCIIAGIVVAAAGAVGWSFVQPTLRCFPPAVVALSEPEPDAVAFLRATDVRRVVVYFDFGEYAIFHLRNQLQVSIDNRRETVYSDRVVQANLQFARGSDPGYADRIGADAVWWPKANAHVLAPLERSGWVRRFEGPRTIILLKTRGDLVRGRNAVGSPCFPNP